MKYINANTILPDVVAEELQKYVQAGHIYIPAKNDQHKSWGEISGYRRNWRSVTIRLPQNISGAFLLKSLPGVIFPAQYHAAGCP